MVDPRVIEQVLDSPTGRTVARSPIARTMLLQDPSSAGQVTAYLDAGLRRRTHALALLAFYDERAWPFFLPACSGLSSLGRAIAVQVMYPMLSGLGTLQARDLLVKSRDDLQVFLNERFERPIPREDPIEPDFRVRTCDVCYISMLTLLDPEADLSVFRDSENEERDAEIRRFINSMGGAPLV